MKPQLDDTIGMDRRQLRLLFDRGLVWGTPEGSRIIAASAKQAQRIADRIGQEIDGQIIGEVQK